MNGGLKWLRHGQRVGAAHGLMRGVSSALRLPQRLARQLLAASLSVANTLAILAGYWLRVLATEWEARMRSATSLRDWQRKRARTKALLRQRLTSWSYAQPARGVFALKTESNESIPAQRTGTPGSAERTTSFCRSLDLSE